MDDEGRGHAARLRVACEKRSEEKGISLAEALRQVTSEGTFSAQDRARGERLAAIRQENNGAKGWARGAFHRAVQAKIVELKPRYRHLSEAGLFKFAADAVAKENASALADYRRDSLSL